ncbi:hypothetical protein [Sphingomonas sp. HMP6]|uniref:hypothetical protein n=1 Tax=Sphingomonas sp. HMP6 TaxID=1517551 RepID=UPI0015965B22|nr:hypothetical protein [Sphingomonas sp. HMP6]BCA58128.1 hypothetical protein HMP06_0897 [Sphingomonas sp. HMP6]
MQKDIDLSGVDPARWPEIRRRVGILDEFVAVHRPPLEVRAAFASRMGLSVSQFLMLARVWRTTRDASAIPGARSRNAVATTRRLPARPLEVVRETIDALGPTARRRIVLAEVARRCAAESVATPSDSTVDNLLADARANMVSTPDVAAETLIDECAVKLPVAQGAEIIMPRLLIAIALPSRVIMATRVSCDPDIPPSFPDLLTQLDAIGAAIPPIRAPHYNDDQSGPDQSGNPADDRPSLRRVLGNRLGNLQIVHRASMARPGTALVASRHASAITTADAVAAIGAAVSAHNARLVVSGGQRIEPTAPRP